MDEKEKICRICASNTPHVRNIFEVIHDEKRLVDILEYCLQRPLQTGDCFPNCICSNCSIDLIKTYDFFILFEKSEKLFVSRSDAMINTNQIKIETTCPLESEFIPEIIQKSDHEIFVPVIEDVTIEEQQNKLEFKSETESDYYEYDESDKLPETIDYECIDDQNSQFVESIRGGGDDEVEKERRFQCSICFKRFNNNSNLKSHFRVHTGEKKYKCIYCDRAFARSNGRTKHYAIEHKDVHQMAADKNESRPQSSTNNTKFTNEALQVRSKNDGLADEHNEINGDNQRSSAMQRYQCGTCLQFFTARKYLRQHETLHTGEKPYECILSFCDEKFRRSDYRNQHIRKVHPDVVFECFACKLRFNSYYELSRHMQRDLHHNFASSAQITATMMNTSEIKENNVCVDCGKIFSKKQQLYDHRRFHKMENGEGNTCKLCSKTFTHMSNYREHLLIHEGKVEHFCSTCGKGFVLRRRLRAHEATHDRSRPYICLTCGQGFKRRNTLNGHLLTHTGERPYKCKFSNCDAAYASHSGRNKHQRTHFETGPRKFECHICKKLIDEYLDLCRHVKTHSTNRVIFECTYPSCTRCFWTEHNFRKHKRKHTENIFECEYECTQSFKSKAELKAHVRVVHKDELKEYKCTECPATFIIRMLLISHMARHTGGNGENEICDQCGKIFPNATTLRAHSKTHSNEKPYKCGHCPGQYKYKAQLRAHQQIHSGIRNYVCDTCGKAFSWEACLRKHKMIHTGERPFPCTEGNCSKRFNTKYKLDRHILTHTGEKPHQCIYCDRAFAQKNDLTKHLRTHLGPTPYQCDECGESFRLTSELRRHSYQHFEPPTN